MDIVALPFIVLFAVSAVIVAVVLINLRKKRHESAEEQRRKVVQDVNQSTEEKKLQQLEEKRCKTKEERKHREEEARQTDKKEERNLVEEEQQKREETCGSRRRPPLKRGGRPRGTTRQREIEQTPGIKPRSLKPEIVCWNEGWRWIVGTEVPEELDILNVAQNEELLEQDTTDKLRYRLKHAEGAVKVTLTGEEKVVPLVGTGRNYFIFKMRKDWKGLGRLVRHPTTGYYLAIVPQEWKRDEEVSDSARFNPESVQVDGYKAHFFCQEQNTVIGFITANGERIRVESGGPRFQLVGREIGDASEDMGPLFGEQLPRIQTLNEKGWSDVGVIVVGEEGSGRNRWRTQSVPQVGAEEQKLPEEIANRRGGWCFVRIYDNDDNLLESMDFRFLTALNDIRMESSDFLPGPNGYDNVTVQFLHQTDCKAELMDEDIRHALEIRGESGQTIVTVPPKPDCDKSHWILRDVDAEIEVTVLVERIWWAFGMMGVTPTNWVDKPITLFRKDFTAITGKALWVRLPRPRFVRKINVGFDPTRSSSYQVEVEKKEIAIPLRDFCDTKEIENRQEEARMMIWVQPEGAKPDETLVVKVPADQPPPIKQKQQVQKIILKEEKVRLLRANVKCQRGKRKGKGFSRKELTKAEIAIGDVKHLHIPYDKRRRTSHSWNVESLKYITEE
ncbi:hypothetical protein KAX02_06730 [candidate division WOR-3 bacterium]|nr:hypothetical protein [candidate division WOR-3 bacterium]